MSSVLTTLLTAIGLNGCWKGSRQSIRPDVYREVAFRYLLESEAKRSERSGHPCHILFIYRANIEGAVVPMGHHISRMVTEALSENLRATDYIGWYRDEQILGALLPAMGQVSVAIGHDQLRFRLKEIFRAKLKPEGICSVQIRVYRHDTVAEI